MSSVYVESSGLKSGDAQIHNEVPSPSKLGSWQLFVMLIGDDGITSPNGAVVRFELSVLNPTSSK